MDQQQIVNRIADKLVGKTISAVRYMTDEESADVGFNSNALVIVFADGNYIYPSMDDEGNEAGALVTSFEDLDTIGVWR